MTDRHQDHDQTAREPKASAHLLGLGLDGSDGHKRITQAEKFSILGSQLLYGEAQLMVVFDLKVDFYNLTNPSNNPIDITLRAGDQIIVPTIGEVVAIAGDVRRPTIIELSNQESDLNLEKLLNYQ